MKNVARLENYLYTQLKSYKRKSLKSHWKRKNKETQNRNYGGVLGVGTPHRSFVSSGAAVDCWQSFDVHSAYRQR